ncbi:hypothetical protein FRC17_009177 [Serendipita sp. 399]|nr:hypothetical protein FRC17_009177 [Serendipita sp. 399]
MLWLSDFNLLHLLSASLAAYAALIVDKQHPSSSLLVDSPQGGQVMVNLVPINHMTEPLAANKTIWLLGDRREVVTVLNFLADGAYTRHHPTTKNCQKVTTKAIVPFNSTSHTLDIVQRYDTPLFVSLGLGIQRSSTHHYPSLLHCVNNTIITALTSFDALPSTSKVDTGELLGIGVGVFIGVVVVLVLVSTYAIFCFIIPCYNRIMTPASDTQTDSDEPHSVQAISMPDISSNVSGREDREGEEGQDPSESAVPLVDPPPISQRLLPQRTQVNPHDQHTNASLMASLIGQSHNDNILGKLSPTTLDPRSSLLPSTLR